MTEKPMEDRSDIDKELYSDLRTIKPHEGEDFVFGFLFCFGFAFAANRLF